MFADTIRIVTGLFPAAVFSGEKGGKSMKKRCCLFAVILLVSILFTGCFSFDSDDFYALPKLPEEFRGIQDAVKPLLKGGSYSSPVSGNNRQAIQQADLDGDGRDEVLVFCKVEGDHPLRLLILEGEKDKYTVTCTIESEGSDFNSVEYAQIDGEPGLEILLTLRLGEQLQQFLKVYTLDEGKPVEMMRSDYSAFTTLDIDSDGKTDVFLVRSNSDGPRGFAELYRYRAGSLVKDTEAGLSMAADAVKRIITGQVADGAMAVFVASAYDETNLITDVFALSSDHFTNISKNDESGQSAQTVRNYFVYSADVDGDGIIEMPNTLPLRTIGRDQNSLNQYSIVWYNLNIDGSRTEKMCTYHNFDEGWFLVLPDAWREGLSVTKVKLGRADTGTRFYLQGEGTRTVLLTIYAFTGENAAQRSTADGRSLLAQRGEVWYSILPGEGLDIDLAELQSRFSFIAPDLLPNAG